MEKNNLNLDTYCKNTWCPGCGDFGILAAIKKAVGALLEKGVKKENIVLVSGIGCHAKIVDYLNLNTFSLYCNSFCISKSASLIAFNITSDLIGAFLYSSRTRASIKIR